MTLATGLPKELVCALRNYQLLPTRWILTVSVATQTIRLFERNGASSSGARTASSACSASYEMRTWLSALLTDPFNLNGKESSASAKYSLRKKFLISTSGHGVGQRVNS